MTKIIIPVKPVPKGRPRFTRSGHTYTPKATRQYEKAVAQYTKMVIKNPLQGALWMDIVINKKPPQSWSNTKKQKAIDGLIKPIVKPDIDNYVKSIKDGMEGVAFKNDSQVVQIHARKRYAEEDSAVVRLNVLDD